MVNKFIIAGLFGVFIVLSGFWLSRTGKPLNTLILTAHKLISLAAVVVLVITVYQIHQAAPLSPVEIAASAVTILFVVVMIASGGWLSAAKTVPAIVTGIHQVVPYLALLSTAATLYLVLVRR